MPLIKFPGVRTVVTYSLIGIVGYAGLQQLPDNQNIETMRRLMEYAVVFFFGTKMNQPTDSRPRE